MDFEWSPRAQWPAKVYRVCHQYQNTRRIRGGFVVKSPSGPLYDIDQLQSFYKSVRDHRNQELFGTPFISVFADQGEASNCCLAAQDTFGVEAYLFEINTHILPEGKWMASVKDIEGRRPKFTRRGKPDVGRGGANDSEWLILHTIEAGSISQAYITASIIRQKVQNLLPIQSRGTPSRMAPQRFPLTFQTTKAPEPYIPYRVFASIEDPGPEEAFIKEPPSSTARHRLRLDEGANAREKPRADLSYGLLEATGNIPAQSSGQQAIAPEIPAMLQPLPMNFRGWGPKQKSNGHSPSIAQPQQRSLLIQNLNARSSQSQPRCPNTTSAQDNLDPALFQSSAQYASENSDVTTLPASSQPLLKPSPLLSAITQAPFNLHPPIRMNQATQAAPQNPNLQAASRARPNVDPAMTRPAQTPPMVPLTRSGEPLFVRSFDPAVPIQSPFTTLPRNRTNSISRSSAAGPNSVNSAMQATPASPSQTQPGQDVAPQMQSGETMTHSGPQEDRGPAVPRPSALGMQPPPIEQYPSPAKQYHRSNYSYFGALQLARVADVANNAGGVGSRSNSSSERFNVSRRSSIGIRASQSGQNQQIPQIQVTNGWEQNSSQGHILAPQNGEGLLSNQNGMTTSAGLPPQRKRQFDSLHGPQSSAIAFGSPIPHTNSSAATLEPQLQSQASTLQVPTSAPRSPSLSVVQLSSPNQPLSRSPSPLLTPGGSVKKTYKKKALQCGCLTQDTCSHVFFNRRSNVHIGRSIPKKGLPRLKDKTCACRIHPCEHSVPASQKPAPRTQDENQGDSSQEERQQGISAQGSAVQGNLIPSGVKSNSSAKRGSRKGGSSQVVSSLGGSK